MMSQIFDRRPRARAGAPLAPERSPSASRSSEARRRLAALVLVMVLAGCGGQNRSADSVAGDFATNVEKRDYAKAYELLSDEARQAVSLRDFERLLEAHPELAKEIVDALRGRNGAPRVTATLTTKSGRVLVMVLENGEFRFDETAVEVYPRRTPLETIRSFVAALDRQRYDVLLEFIPRDQRDEKLTAAVLKAHFEGPQKSELDALKASLGGEVDSARVEILGERAVVSYGTQSKVDLVLEDGLWTIEEFK